MLGAPSSPNLSEFWNERAGIDAKHAHFCGPFRTDKVILCPQDTRNYAADWQNGPSVSIRQNRGHTMKKPADGGRRRNCLLVVS